MRSCIPSCLTECLALRMCWTNALKPTASPSTPNSPAWWAGKGGRGCSHPAFGETGEGTGPGRTGTPLLMVDAAVGTAPVSPIALSPGAGPLFPLTRLSSP